MRDLSVILFLKNLTCRQTSMIMWGLETSGNKWIAGRKMYPYRLMLRMLLPASLHMLKQPSVTFT